MNRQFLRIWLPASAAVHAILYFLLVIAAKVAGVLAALLAVILAVLYPRTFLAEPRRDDTVKLVMAPPAEPEAPRSAPAPETVPENPEPPPEREPVAIEKLREVIEKAVANEETVKIPPQQQEQIPEETVPRSTALDPGRTASATVEAKGPGANDPGSPNTQGAGSATAPPNLPPDGLVEHGSAGDRIDFPGPRIALADPTGGFGGSPRGGPRGAGHPTGPTGINPDGGGIGGSMPGTPGPGNGGESAPAFGPGLAFGGGLLNGAGDALPGSPIIMAAVGPRTGDGIPGSTGNPGPGTYGDGPGRRGNPRGLYASGGNPQAPSAGGPVKMASNSGRPGIPGEGGGGDAGPGYAFPGAPGGGGGSATPGLPAGFIKDPQGQGNEGISRPGAGAGGSVPGSRAMPGRSMPGGFESGAVPEMTTAALFSQRSGTLVMRVYFDSQGKFVRAERLEGTEDDALVGSAMRSVRKYKFKPRLRDGHSVGGNVTFRFTFDKDGTVTRTQL